MPSEDPSLTVDRILDSGRNIRLGKGVVAKTSYVAAFVLGVWGVIAWRLGPDLYSNLGLLAIGVVSTLFSMWFIRGTQKFAQENPGQAMLEGAELLEWRRMDVQVKGAPPVLDNSVIDTTAIPQLEHK